MNFVIIHDFMQNLCAWSKICRIQTPKEKCSNKYRMQKPIGLLMLFSIWGYPFSIIISLKDKVNLMLNYERLFMLKNREFIWCYWKYRFALLFWLKNEGQKRGVLFFSNFLEVPLRIRNLISSSKMCLKLLFCVFSYQRLHLFLEYNYFNNHYWPIAFSLTVFSRFTLCS